MATAIGIAVLLVITLHPRAPAGAACGRAGPVHLDDAGQLAVAATRPLAPPLPGGVARAYQFLDQMMDLRTTGPARRLVQSYTGGLLGQRGDTSASSYDNALLIDAYLAEGTSGGVARAKTIGGALVYLQAHDRAHDGRLRNGYAPVPLHAANDIQVTDPASSTGTLAWAGQALAQLYAATRIRAYLRGAIALGDWIQSQCRDGRGPGGYTGGDTAAGAHDRMEVDRAQHRRVRVLPVAGPGDRQPGVVAAGRLGPAVRRVDVEPGPGPLLPRHHRRRRDPERHRAGRGREQLVLPGPAGSRVCGVGGLGRVQPGRVGGRVPRAELLHR